MSHPIVNSCQDVCEAIRRVLSPNLAGQRGKMRATVRDDIPPYFQPKEIWVHDRKKVCPSIERIRTLHILILHGTTRYHDAASSKILGLNRTAAFLGLLHLCSHTLSTSILIKIKRSMHVHVTCCKTNGEKGFQASMLGPFR